jgi:XapX domain-containing protein
VAALKMNMKAFVASLAVGLLVGVIYALFNVRSPAPPVIALIGLLGKCLNRATAQRNHRRMRSRRRTPKMSYPGRLQP